MSFRHHYYPLTTFRIGSHDAKLWIGGSYEQKTTSDTRLIPHPPSFRLRFRPKGRKPGGDSGDRNNRPAQFTGPVPGRAAANPAPGV